MSGSWTPCCLCWAFVVTFRRVWCYTEEKIDSCNRHDGRGGDQNLAEWPKDQPILKLVLPTVHLWLGRGPFEARSVIRRSVTSFPHPTVTTTFRGLALTRPSHCVSYAALHPHDVQDYHHSTSDNLRPRECRGRSQT